MEERNNGCIKYKNKNMSITVIGTKTDTLEDIKKMLSSLVKKYKVNNQK